MRFDEELDFAEDFPFILTALWNAKNVCLLPQLIGYVYFVNSESMLQSMGNKGEETVLMVARSFKKVIDLCLSYGIDMNDTMHMFLMMVAGAMLSRGKVSEGLRKEVFELMTPYAKLLKPLETSKLYSQKYLDDLNTLPKYFLSEGGDSSDFTGEGLLAYDMRTVPENIQEFQQRALYHIIDSGTNTDYGKRYHFSEIATMEGYRLRHVPAYGQARRNHQRRRYIHQRGDNRLHAVLRQSRCSEEASGYSQAAFPMLEGNGAYAGRQEGILHE